MDVTSIGVPSGSASADTNATTLYVVDRAGARIVAFDVASTMMVASHASSAEPDYLRVAPTTGEVWVTVPGRNRIEILEPTGLAVVGSVTTPSPPEGLTFDTQGRAYVNGDGAVVAIDVARRVVVGEWDVGCGYSHGFPQVDLGYGLAMGGCRPNGGVGVTTIDGEQRAGYEAGGGPAVLAYDATLHHLYVRGDPSSMLSILAVCPDGQLGELARVSIPERGHAAVTDERGHVWVADSTTGGLVRVTDPFPGTQ
jgi:DNA-binding beta-propeller fold protein YncE